MWNWTPTPPTLLSGTPKKPRNTSILYRGELVLRTETGDYALNEGDSLVFDSSLKHTYINQQDILLAFMVINYYPN